MQTTVDSSDGDLARAVAARGPGSAEAAESELYRRFAPRVRLYGLVTALRADFSGVDAVTLSVTGPGDSSIAQFEDVPAPGSGGEVLWVTPAAVVHEMPSMRLQLTLASVGATRAELGRYVLEHSALPPPA